MDEFLYVLKIIIESTFINGNVLYREHRPKFQLIINKKEKFNCDRNYVRL